MFGVGRPGNESGEGPEGGENAGGSVGNAGGGDAGNGGKGSKPSKRVIALGTAAVAVVAAGVGIAVSQHSSKSNSSGTAAVQSGSGKLAVGPIHVESISPAAKAKGVDGAAPIIVSFSAPVAANSPHPQVLPAVAGTWETAGDTMTFSPSVAFAPAKRVTVEVPSGTDGVRSTNGGLLTTTVTDRFTTGNYSQEALAELLAQQGYLPMTWSPKVNGATRAAIKADGDAAAFTAAGQAYDPPAGKFRWQHGYPSMLKGLWSPDKANVILRGAVMAFESEHGMTVDGSLTPILWKALIKAQSHGQQNKNGYTYALASKQTPETLTIWHDGHVVEHTLANTGIPVSPTADGTFPVYQKYRFQIMRGVNPDGSAYSDPVSYVSYFNGGDAVHYFPRPSYGFQQSLGCVELPWDSAAKAYPFLTYGSLVTVAG